MPFPLAHPAAVLPLRRFCPQRLNFPALVIGSLVPDAGYIFGEGRFGGTFTHEVLGGFAMCLPLGLGMVALFYRLRTLVVKLLPEAYQRVLLPLCQRSCGPVWAVVLSLLIGIWTHQLWDSFTHKDGWAVEHLPILQTAVLSAGSRTARLCHVLWYGCSLAGVIWVFLVFEKWKQACAGRALPSTRELLRDAVLVGLLMLPIALAHHLIQQNHLGLCLVAAACAAPVIGFVLRLRTARRGKI